MLEASAQEMKNKRKYQSRKKSSAPGVASGAVGLGNDVGIGVELGATHCEASPIHAAPVQNVPFAGEGPLALP